jgi:CRP/FNR family cyclic AMP-dependent transcriptional regulator
MFTGSHVRLHSLARTARSDDECAGAFLQTDPKPAAGGPPTLLSHLTDAEAADVLSKGKPKAYYRGHTLFEQGTPNDGIYVVESGRVRVFYTAPSNREVTLAYWHPGNFVGGPEIFGRGLHIWSGVAATNVTALHLPSAVLKSLVTKIPGLAIGIIEGLAFKGKCYSMMAQMLGTRSVTERLAHLLLHLADLYGVEDSDGIFLAARFTHEDIAHMVGATRQWVTISLKRLSDQGVLKLKPLGIVIANAEALVSIRDRESSKEG